MVTGDSLREVAGGTSLGPQLRAALYMAADALDKRPKTTIKVVQNWPLIAAALLIGLGLALLLDHTLFAPAYTCSGWSSGTYTCHRR